MASYTAQLDAIMRALRTNYANITPANGYTTTVVLVHERDDVIRPNDVTGAIVKITDLTEDFSYFTAQDSQSDLSYAVEGFLYATTASSLRTGVRSFVDDAMKAHNSDLYLSVADLANGGAGQRLVIQHFVRRVIREYEAPHGYFRMEVDCQYRFNRGD